jgi:general secretion pathway protein D
MPSILTNDNEQAIIKALDEEPTFSLNQGQNTDSTTFSGYEEAGITLTISPSISAGNYLKLQVKIEVSNFDESADSSPPPKSTRLVETAVTIPDGHTMVIGGVIIDDKTEVEQKIPLLGDLPLVGWLFRSTNQSNRKVNLYTFITPHIIGDDFANLDDISYQKKKEVEALRGDVLLFDPDFEMTNADERVIGAGANWIFEIPSYAEPDTGEMPVEAIKQKNESSSDMK